MTKVENISGEEKPSVFAERNASDKRARDAMKDLQARQAAGEFFPSAGMPRIDLLPLQPVNTLADNGDGQTNTLPVDEHVNGLKVTLHEWPDIGTENWVMSFAIDDDDWTVIETVSPGFTSLEVTIPLGDHSYDHGRHTLRYLGLNELDFNEWEGVDFDFYVDIIDPNRDNEPDKPLLPLDLPGGVITPAYLDQHGSVTFTLPTPDDHKPGDTYSFFIDSQEVVTNQPLATPFEVVVPRSTFDGLSAGLYSIQYTLTDRAGNRTDMSVQETITLSKVPAPVLRAPDLSAGGAITLAEARIGVDVRHDYDDPLPGDIVTVTWAGVRLDSHFIPTEYKTATFEDILQGGGREYSGEVTYELNRDGAIYLSPPAQIDVDLNHTGPVNPDEPNPINTLLDPAVLTSSTNQTDLIEAADVGQDATITVQLYQGAAVGELIQVYYGDAASPVGQPVDLEAGDITAGEITVNLTWAQIQAKGNGTIRLFYQIYPAGKPENWQQSPDTDVTVTVNNISDLPDAQFPGRHPTGNVINCSHEPWINGVDVLMPYPALREGDILTLNWVLDSTYPPAVGPLPQTPVEATRKEFPHTVNITEAAAGQVIFNVPWGPWLSTVTRGSIVVFWKLSRDNGTVTGTSLQSFVRLSREGPGVICGPAV
ncbi:hypothetical protein [Pseudomonas sp. Marseille-P9899]|uniref:hypothetical protein n=1 Tax=Pseudomonas sp. Marseille-P9899 TaxID=2730401 RepID=UPI00158D0166|nr:hypothetical protein [Pseudomonas sp. Marseille-P9899]